MGKTIMRNTTLDLLMDNIGNLGNRIHALEIAFLDYTEENPKSSDQWQEERLRALEHKVSQVQPTHERECGEDSHMDQAIVEMLAKVNNYEWRLDTIAEAQDAKITKLENVVAELGLALGNLTKELQDLKDAKIN